MCQDEYPLFVTWTISKDEDLRGCIGTFEAEPLCDNLCQYALLAALEDDRFEPISCSEVPHLQVCVSLLCNFTKRDTHLDWTIGVHGVSI